MKNKKFAYDSVHDWIFTETKGVVQSGPFAKMRMLREHAWKVENLASQCLGCYEQELHPHIEYEIERLSKKPSPKIADLGCAEGYYAVGLARRLPSATVYGVDISNESLAIANKIAAANGVTIKTGAPLSEVLTDADLVVVDVEGHEHKYLDLEQAPSLRRANIIVECHDFNDKPLPITRTLVKRFAATHDIDTVYESARDPNKFPVLTPHTSFYRWMAVCEGRPCTMHWLVMRSRND